VQVQNPAPGSPFSNQVTFPVKSPVPGITSVSPTSGKACGAAFTPSVNGNNFTSKSKFQWNGPNKTTWFISVTLLKARIETTDIGSAGTDLFRVLNPAASGDLLSGTKTFTVM
jgi:hypothetical protein